MQQDNRAVPYADVSRRMDRTQAVPAGSTHAYVDIVTRGASPSWWEEREGAGVSTAPNNRSLTDLENSPRAAVRGTFCLGLCMPPLHSTYDPTLLYYAFGVYCTTVTVMGSIEHDVRIVQGATLRRCSSQSTSYLTCTSL
jgi:hypothetical protein